MVHLGQVVERFISDANNAAFQRAPDNAVTKTRSPRGIARGAQGQACGAASLRQDHSNMKQEELVVATLLPWTSVEVGELEIFAPAVPCLVVHTWYIDDQADSTVTYFWQDEATGLINYELVFAEPVGFEAALAWAKEHAPTRGVERIHVKHGPAAKKLGRPAAKAGPRKKAAPQAKIAARPKKMAEAKPKKMAEVKKRGRKTSAR